MQIDSVIDAVNIALSGQGCTTALTAILPLYNSVNTDNAIRLSTAASYGCAARVNLLDILGDLVSFQGDLAGSGFWEFLVQEFPSTVSPIDDKIPQAAESATDAIMATLNPATILVPAFTINSTSNNPGSLEVNDRTSDANSFLTFASMSLMGSLLYRNGNPLANNHKGNALPWTSADLMQGDGCALASGVLNFNDGLNSIAAAAPSSIAIIYQKIQTLFATGLDLACQVGCTVCGGSVSCTSCPTTLRSRASCTGVNTDVNSCAAAGIINFINDSWQGPP